ncbi:hypothetical protein OAL15_03040 [Flavobacteriales bacterium]|nr:hypothetical protein [Flavobacteriales bacterium]
MKRLKLFILALIGLTFCTEVSAQTDTDGAMRIFHYTDYFYTNNDDEGGNDEHTWYYYRREEADFIGANNAWDQSICTARNCGGGCYGYPAWGLDRTYNQSNIPTQFRMRGRYWENDRGSRCAYNTVWYGNSDDDYNNWEQQYNVRQGCPYVWTYYGWQGSFWRNVHYTRTYYSSPRPNYARANGSGSYSHCGPQTITLSSAGKQCGNSRYYWYRNGVFIGSTTGTLSYYNSGTATFTVYTNDQGANSLWNRSMTVTMTAVPTANAGSDITHCSTGNITTNGASATGSTYLWTWAASSGSAVLSSATSLNGWVLNPSSDSGSGTLTLTVSSPGCPNATSTRNVTWDRPPSGTAGVNITQCFSGALSAITMSSSGMNGYGESVTGTWSTQGGSGTGTWSQNTSNPGAATFTPTSNSGSRTMRLRIQSTSGECNGNTYDYTTTITWNRVVLDAGTPVTQCDLANITTSDATIVGGGYGSATWTYIPTAGSATLNNATSLNGCFLSGLSAGGGNGILRLTVTGNSPCGTQTSDKTVQWSSGPLGNAGSNLNVCSGAGTPIPMTGATGGGASGTPAWSGGSGLGTWTNGGLDPAAWTFTPNASNPNGSFTATLNVSGTAPCVGSAIPTTRTVSWTTPPTGSIGGTVNSCDGSAAITLTGASAGGSLAGTPFTWSVISGGGSVTGSGNNPATYQYSTPGSTGSAELQLVVHAGGHCTTDLTYTQDINWGDITANSPASITSCGNTLNINMAGTATGQYSSVSWTGESGGVWSTTNLTDPAAWVFDPTAASGNFNATLTVNGTGACVGETETSITNVDWDIYPTIDAGAAIFTCSGSGSPIAQTGATAGGQYGSVTWTTSSAVYGAGTWSNGGTNPALWSFTPTTPEGFIIAQLEVQGNASCNGTNLTDVRTIQWSAVPTITSVSVTNQTDCNNPNGTIIVVASGNGPLNYSSDGGTAYAPLDTILGIALGSYNIQVQDSVGCTAIYGANPVTVNDVQVCSGKVSTS